MDEVRQTTEPVETQDSAPTPQNEPPKTPPVDDENPPWLGIRLARERKSLLKRHGLTSEEELAALIQQARPKPEAQPEANAVTQAPANPELEEMRRTIAELKAAKEAADIEREKTAKAQKVDAFRQAVNTWAKAGKMPDGFADRAIKYATGDGYDVDKVIGEAVKSDGTIDTESKAWIEFDAYLRRETPEWFVPRGPGTPSNAGGVPEDVQKKELERAARYQSSLIRNGW